MESNIPVTPVRQTFQQTSEQPRADSNSTPVRPKVLEDNMLLCQDKLAILKNQKQGLKRLAEEYLEIPLSGRDLGRVELQAFNDLFNAGNRKIPEKDLYAPLKTFFDTVIPANSRNQFWNHLNSRDSGMMENNSIPDFGLYDRSKVTPTPSGKVQLDFSELLVCLEVKIGEEDAIRSVSKNAKHHNGFRGNNGAQLTFFVEGLKAARQAPFHIIIYVYGVESFRLLVSLPDHLFATEKLKISDCKVEFLSLLSHLSNMNDDDFGLLQKLRKMGEIYTMQLRPMSTEAATLGRPFPEYTGKRNMYRKAGALGSIPWFFEEQSPPSRFFKSRWAHKSKTTERETYEKILEIPDEQASECGGFTKPDIDMTSSGVHEGNFVTKLERAHGWLVVDGFLLSETRESQYEQYVSVRKLHTYCKQYFYSRHFSVITFNKTYKTVTEINNLYEWLVIFTKCATSLGFIMDKLGIFHGDISPKNIVFDRGSDGVLGDVVIIDWECAKNIVPNSEDARLQNDRTGTGLFMSPFVEYRIGQKALDDFNALFFVHCYMLHFFDNSLAGLCRSLFADKVSKLKYASGRNPDDILEEPLDLRANDTLQFMLFNSILREILLAQFSLLRQTKSREIEERLITAFKYRTDKRSEKLIHAFTIACEWFLAGLLGQALPKTDALDKKLENIRTEFEDLSKLLQQFHGVVLAMTQQTREAFKGLKFEGGISIDALKYLYQVDKGNAADTTHAISEIKKVLQTSPSTRQSLSNSLAPLTNSSSGQEKRSADSCEDTVSQGSKRSRQD